MLQNECSIIHREVMNTELSNNNTGSTWGRILCSQKYTVFHPNRISLNNVDKRENIVVDKRENIVMKSLNDLLFLVLNVITSRKGLKNHINSISDTGCIAIDNHILKSGLSSSCFLENFKLLS